MGENEPKTSILTQGQRKFLQAPDVTGSKARMARKRIRERVRQGLSDFRLLTERLDEKDRDEIFDAQPHTEEFRELDIDVTATIEFLYAGLGGDHVFSGPLKRGVSRGEVALGNVEQSMEVEPRFAINPYHRSDPDEILEAIEEGEWDRLRSPDLFQFIRLASSFDAIDFEAIREGLEPPQSPGLITLQWDAPRTKRTELAVDTLDRLEQFEESEDTIDDTINRALDELSDDE